MLDRQVQLVNDITEPAGHLKNRDLTYGARSDPRRGGGGRDAG
jgi:hypothetical protein